VGIEGNKIKENEKLSQLLLQAMKNTKEKMIKED